MTGSWTVDNNQVKAVGGNKSRIIIPAAAFVADATDGSIPALKIGTDHSSGMLQRVSIVFGDPAPAGDDLMLQVTDANGLVIANPDADKISASSDISVNKVFGGPLYAHVTGNITLSAQGKVVLYVVN